MEAEVRLAEYRARKRNEERTNSSMFQRFWGNSKYSSQVKTPETKESHESSKSVNAKTEGQCTSTSVESQSTKLLSLSNVLKFSLWLVLFGLFVELEFGSVYFIMSCFYLVYLNMRTGGRKPDEPSAYSVFNPNCERIDGTLSAEQFEKELIYGPGSVGRS